MLKLFNFGRKIINKQTRCLSSIDKLLESADSTQKTLLSEVCSHPLYTFNELDGNFGVRNGVRRRAIYEFNLPLEISDLSVVQRIIYFKPMDHEILAENELGR